MMPATHAPLSTAIAAVFAATGTILRAGAPAAAATETRHACGHAPHRRRTEGRRRGMDPGRRFHLRRKPEPGKPARRSAHRADEGVRQRVHHRTTRHDRVDDHDIRGHRPDRLGVRRPQTRDSATARPAETQARSGEREIHLLLGHGHGDHFGGAVPPAARRTRRVVGYGLGSDGGASCAGPRRRPGDRGPSRSET